MTENVAPYQATEVPEGGNIAPLANIGLMEEAIARLANRGPGEPGMMVFSGYSGYGKSVAAAWVKARHNAYYLQLNDFVTKRSLVVSLCQVVGLPGVRKLPPAGERAVDQYVPPKGTIGQLAEMVAAQLHNARRPLILDEFDFAIDKSLVMTVFSLYEMSQASIVLIGEEAMPAKLKRWEKFDGRVLDTFYAEPLGMTDARTLLWHRYRNEKMTIADDFLRHLVSREIAGGSVRRLSNNLATIYETGNAEGWEYCDLERWGSRPLQQSTVKRRPKGDEEGL